MPADPPGRGRGRRGPRRLEPSDLNGIALHYLGRFSSSAENLRRVLRRRALRSARHHEFDPAPLLAAIEPLLARLTANGSLDDGRFAVGRTLSLHRRGRSRRAIEAELQRHGVDAEAIAGAAAVLARASGDPELAAACAFARRRRIGPWRPAEARAAMRSRDMAALARGGFSLETARRILAAVSPEEAEAMVGPQGPATSH